MSDLNNLLNELQNIYSEKTADHDKKFQDMLDKLNKIVSNDKFFIESKNLNEGKWMNLKQILQTLIKISTDPDLSNNIITRSIKPLMNGSDNILLKKRTVSILLFWNFYCYVNKEAYIDPLSRLSRVLSAYTIDEQLNVYINNYLLKKFQTSTYKYLFDCAKELKKQEKYEGERNDDMELKNYELNKILFCKQTMPETLSIIIGDYNPLVKKQNGGGNIMQIKINYKIN